MNEPEGRTPLDLLIFEIAGRRYGLPAGDVREIVRVVPPVPLPGGPNAVEGVINVRGRVVPVLDVRRRFGLPARPLELTDHMVITGVAGRQTAMRVDRALGLSAGEVEDLPGGLPHGPGVLRIAKLPDGLVLVADDLRALLSDRDAAALVEALAAALPGPESPDRGREGS